MRRFVISERSMSPALEPGDRFLARRLHRPRRGAIVFFPHPERSDFWLAKRVVGLPGEVVEIADGEVLVDGNVLLERHTVDPAGPPGRWRIPDRHAFVLSDARHRTRADSRTFGPIPLHEAHVAVLRYRRGNR